MNRTRWKRPTALLWLATLLLPGCAGPNARLQYLVGGEKTLSHYRDYASAIEYPVNEDVSETDPNLFRAPRTITSLQDVENLPVTLSECVRMALSNATILRDDQSFGTPSNPILANPQRAASVFDQGIQDTGFLFGNRGIEASLTDFDPTWTNSMQWGRTEDVQNSANLGIPAGGVLVDETAQFQSRLEKTFANSSTFAVEQNWNYSQNNNTRMFQSAYTGVLQAEFRQPLLSGSGTEFTRIAGPAAQGVRGVSGVSQGVLISRINSDISLIDFEQSVAVLVRDVEKRYWDLYLALQLYESEISTFKDIVDYRSLLAGREDSRDVEFQAANRLYEADARMKGSLGDVLSAEFRLRRLLGLPLNDGKFLMPSDKPTEAKLTPDWESTLIESLAHRPELRKQKWEIKSLELQLKAAKNQARPRLDFVSQYRVNGFGDNLTGQEDDDGVTDAGYASAYESLTQGNNTGWGLGFQFTMPLGLRLARAQVRNYELRLQKARAVLQKQEEEVAFELNDSIIKMDQWYLLSESGAKRSDAARESSDRTALRVENERQRDPIAIARVLEARITSREADQGYLRSVVEYNKAITDLNYSKGTLLSANSVFLAEGEWNPAAYQDARRRAEAMTHALDNTHVETTPPEFVAGPAGAAWEKAGPPDRPHVPGVVNGLPEDPSFGAPSSAVPEVPAVPPMLEDAAPMPPGEPAVPQPPQPEPEEPPLFDATQAKEPQISGISATRAPVTSVPGASVPLAPTPTASRIIVRPPINAPTAAPNPGAGRQRMAGTGKPGL